MPAAQKIALVSGANRGIGLEIVRQLAGQGIRTILAARKLEQGEQSARAIRGDVIVRQLDVTDPQSVARIERYIDAEFGRLDILVNNAAVLLDRNERASNIDLDVVRTTLETNLYGAWRMCQAFVPLMKRHNCGRIVNISSGAGAFDDMAGSNGTWSAYNLSKTALNALTVMLASELRGTNILVNAACPGWVRTDMGGGGAPLSVEAGADTPVWLATLLDGGPSGRFFRERKEIAW
jgi:NAD(P)-dependent dehydrogenase (short-subunit alcohol dehydrogenase family)